MPIPPFTLPLPSQEDTERLGVGLVDHLGPGDVVALVGPIGAGKSVLARAFIAEHLNRMGQQEDIPSPTFTLVQTYQARDFEIWHCDLYRLGHPDEVLELGLDAAFDTTVSLIEWPDRLGDDLPQDALRITLTPDHTGEKRTAELTWQAGAWDTRLANLMNVSHAR